MTVIRIVPNLPATDPVTLARFYAEVFDLDVPMDMGWIAFLQNDQSHQIELHTAIGHRHSRHFDRGRRFRRHARPPERPPDHPVLWPRG